MHRLYGGGYLVAFFFLTEGTGFLKYSLENFEMASLPTTKPEDRDRLLSFVVCGGGPTVGSYPVR